MSTSDSVEPSSVVPLPSAQRRRRRTARWIAGGVCVALIATAIVAATRPSAQGAPFESPLVDHPAPTFSQVDFHEHPVSLAGLRGHYVYVNFFSSWCTPCQTEMPSLVKFAFENSQNTHGAVMVSVVNDDPNAAARAFVEQWGTTWPTIPDPGGQIGNHYGVTGTPTTFLVNPSGRVVAAWGGAVSVSWLTSTLASAQHRYGVGSPVTAALTNDRAGVGGG